MDGSGRPNKICPLRREQPDGALISQEKQPKGGRSFQLVLLPEG